MPYVLGLDVFCAAELGALGVPPVALGLVGLDFCAAGLGADGVPYFLAFNDLLLVNAIIFHRQNLLSRLFLVLLTISVFP